MFISFLLAKKSRAETTKIAGPGNSWPVSGDCDIFNCSCFLTDWPIKKKLNPAEIEQLSNRQKVVPLVEIAQRSA